MKKLLVLLFLSLSFLTEGQTRKNLIEAVDFGKGTVQPTVFGRNVYTSDGLTVPGKEYKGKKMGLFKLKGGNSSVYRSEIFFTNAAQKEERLGLVMNFPSAYFSKRLNDWFIICQWHGSDKKDGNEGALQPHIALFIQSGRLKLAIRSDVNRVSKQSTIKVVNYDLGPLVMDKDLVIYFYNKLSYKSDGITTLSINGKQVVNHRGPNNYNNADPYGYLKMGIYCRGLNQGQVYAYFLGPVYIGNANSTWQDVLP